MRRVHYLIYAYRYSLPMSVYSFVYSIIDALNATGIDLWSCEYLSFVIRFQKSMEREAVNWESIRAIELNALIYLL